MFAELRDYKLPPGKSLGMKVVYKDGKPEYECAAISFRWETSLKGYLTYADDWNPDPKVGGGLHVWEWGQGDLGTSKIWHRPDVLWLAVEYDTAEAVNIEDRCVKVPKCKTVAVSLNHREKILQFIQAHTPEAKQGPLLFEIEEVEEGEAGVVGGGVAIVRGKGRATAGYGGVAIVRGGGKSIDEIKYSGVAIAGHWGVALAGAYGYACVEGGGGEAVAGDWGTAIVGDGGKAKAGWCGIAIAGERGSAWTGHGGKAEGWFAVAGDWGEASGITGAIAGNFGTAIVGDGGEAMVGFKGKARAGVGGLLVFSLEDEDKEFQVGENGIKPDTYYKLDDSGNPVEVS